nr:reverse transcriptase domain-containing protein [Tanacetum cinerariifolium]
MSAMANTTSIVTTVTKTATKEKAPNETETAPRINILDFCGEHYANILPVMDRIRRDKRREVHTRLDFGENSRKSRRMREDSQNSSAKTLSARYRNPSKRPQIRDRLQNNDGNVFGRLGHRKESAFKRLSDTYSPSATKSRPDKGNTLKIIHTIEVVLTNETLLLAEIVLEAETAPMASKNRMAIPTLIEQETNIDEEDLAVPWTCEEVDPFTPRIHNFKSSRKMRMPNNVKTYDGTGDPEDHVKIFQAATQVKRWAMPTWCHMFNSTLIGAARVWFDELPPESIDGYKDLKVAFLAYFMQQNKYVKYLIEIHNIKQRDGETIEDFMEQFKAEIRRMKGSPECMWISGFMHGVNNPELIKRLNEHVPKTMKEMMIANTAFIRGEAAPTEARGSNKFTPLTRTPKEILAAEAGKFQPPPPMVTPVEKRSSNKFCDFHNDKGHSTDECMQLKKQIEELVRAGKLSHLIKESKHGRDQPKVGMKEAPVKDKSMAIYMIQSWHRMTRQKVTQSFERVREITFPSLTDSNGTEGPLVIEAETGGHVIHRIPGIKEIHAVSSTAHGMLKFPADEGMVTIRSTILIPAECAMVITSSKEIPNEAVVCHENFKVALHPNFSDQKVAIEGMLSTKGRT